MSKPFFKPSLLYNSTPNLHLSIFLGQKENKTARVKSGLKWLYTTLNIGKNRKELNAVIGHQNKVLIFFYTSQQLHHHIQQSPVLWKAQLFPSLKDEIQLWPSLLWAIDLQLLMCLNKHPSQVFNNKVEVYQCPYFSIRCRRLVTFECFHKNNSASLLYLVY